MCATNHKAAWLYTVTVLSDSCELFSLERIVHLRNEINIQSKWSGDHVLAELAIQS